METQKFSSDLQELTFEQASGINGGESLWYWVAYGIGASARGVADAHEWMNKNFGNPPELVGVK